MIDREGAARTAAFLLALGSLVGMFPPLGSAEQNHGSVLASMWALLRYFTIITNLLIIVIFGWIAVRGRDAISPRLVGGIMLAIVLVGVVFNLILGQIVQPTWWARIGDSLHHHIAPVAVPIWWLVFGRHGQLGWKDPWLWALYPLCYSAYILIRAASEPADMAGRYPYFFLDVERFGWPVALGNLTAIAAGFVAFGFALVALDRALARRTTG